MDPIGRLGSPPRTGLIDRLGSLWMELIGQFSFPRTGVVDWFGSPGIRLISLTARLPSDRIRLICLTHYGSTRSYEVRVNECTGRPEAWAAIQPLISTGSSGSVALRTRLLRASGSTRSTLRIWLDDVLQVHWRLTSDWLVDVSKVHLQFATG